MKNLKYWSVLTICLISLSTHAMEQVIEKSFEIGDGGTLDLKTSEGAIKVLPWDKQMVSVKVTKEANNQGVLDKFTVEFDMDGKTLNVVGENANSGFWNRSINVDFEIQVPQEFMLRLATKGGSIKVQEKIVGDVLADTKGGSISVAEVEGDATLDTSGGSIKVGFVHGELKADTSGGNITVDKGGKKVKADTSGGNIRVGKSAGDVRADTSGGNIYIDYSKGSVRADTSGGSIDVRGADGSIEADTSGGRIKIGEAKGDLKADTSGGGITIEAAYATVIANTNAGGIRMDYKNTKPEAGKKIVLDTNVGDIEVSLPSGIGATINAKARGPSRDAIRSDFALNQHKNTARGEVNGGGIPISLEVSNGRIRLEKN